jgi:hypothetical protein
MASYTTTNYRKLLARVLQYFSLRDFKDMIITDKFSIGEVALLSDLYRSDPDKIPD